MDAHEEHSRIYNWSFAKADWEFQINQEERIMNIFMKPCMLINNPFLTWDGKQKHLVEVHTRMNYHRRDLWEWKSGKSRHQKRQWKASSSCNIFILEIHPWCNVPRYCNVSIWITIRVWWRLQHSICASILAPGRVRPWQVRFEADADSRFTSWFAITLFESKDCLRSCW